LEESGEAQFGRRRGRLVRASEFEPAAGREGFIGREVSC